MTCSDHHRNSLLSYFVVFYKSGFTPADLRTAQKYGGTGPCSHSIQAALYWSFQQDPGFFKKDSPDFINSRGQVISASKQVDALGQAQSIVYLSIFICQCFNVSIPYFHVFCIYPRISRSLLSKHVSHSHSAKVPSQTSGTSLVSSQAQPLACLSFIRRLYMWSLVDHTICLLSTG